MLCLHTQAVVLILESDNRPDVKEQALCILANIADGDSAKQFIMSNEDVLKKVRVTLKSRNGRQVKRLCLKCFLQR